MLSSNWGGGQGLRLRSPQTPALLSQTRWQGQFRTFSQQLPLELHKDIFISISSAAITAHSIGKSPTMNDTLIGFEDLNSTLKATGEETRLRILVLLSEAELTVSELTEILRQSQPRIS